MIIIKKTTKYLGEILLGKALITEAQIQEALRLQQQTKEFLGTILLRLGFITERDLLEALSIQFDLPFISLKNSYIEWELVDGFSGSLLIDRRCFPVSQEGDCITMAITNPLNAEALSQAESEAKGRKIKPVLVTEADMDDVIQRYRQYRKSKLQRLFPKG